MSEKLGLQRTYAPTSICFGCGPANEKGLKIDSFVQDNNEVICEWTPQEHHQAFPGMINGGIIGSLLDCHSNWTAAYSIMNDRGLNEPPCTVTAEYSIKLKRPTPANTKLYLKARAISIDGDKVIVEGELLANEKVCATCKGLFVAVKEGHPAYHRWS